MQCRRLADFQGLENVMEKTNARTFLVTVAPYSDDAPPPTAERIDSLLYTSVGGLITVLPYEVPINGMSPPAIHVHDRVVDRETGKVGRVQGLELDSEGQLYVHVGLEEPIILPPHDHREHELHIYRSGGPAWRFRPIRDALSIEHDQKLMAEYCAPWFERQV